MKRLLQLNNSTKNLDPSLFIEATKSRIKPNNPDTVFLIGGGKSLLQYLPDKTILDNQNVITANNGYLLFPDALACHFADWLWFTWHDQNLFKTCVNGNITCCVNYSGDQYIRFYRDRGIVTFVRESVDHLTLNPGKLCGGNTGHQIINLAYHLGFKNIVLLGYDLHQEAVTHWHNGHMRATNTQNFDDIMIPGFNSIHQNIGKYDVNIININKQSALQCFEFGDIEDYIK